MRLIRWHYDTAGNARLQHKAEGAWLDYTLHPLAQNDTAIDGMALSKGFRTAQYLLSLGYSYAPTSAATKRAD